MQHRSELQFVAVLTTLVDVVQRPFAGPLKINPFIERIGAVETSIRPQDEVSDPLGMARVEHRLN